MEATENSEFHAGVGPAAPPTKPKRSQVKNACSSCQKACKKCDTGRPCMRCIKFHIESTCVDSVRKERSRVRRGGKNSGKNSANMQKDPTSLPGMVSTYKDLVANVVAYPKAESKADHMQGENSFLCYPGREQYEMMPAPVMDGVVGAAAAAESCDIVCTDTAMYAVTETGYKPADDQMNKMAWDNAALFCGEQCQQLVADLFVPKDSLGVEGSEGLTQRFEHSGEFNVRGKPPNELAAPFMSSKQSNYTVCSLMPVSPVYTGKQMVPFGCIAPQVQKKSRVDQMSTITLDPSNSQKTVLMSSLMFCPHDVNPQNCRLAQQEYSKSKGLCMSSNAQMGDVFHTQEQQNPINSQQFGQPVKQLMLADMENTIPMHRRVISSHMTGYPYTSHTGVGSFQAVCDQEFSEMYSSVPLYERDQ